MHDCVPHLFPDLPDELLPALSKFLFVGKDEAEQGTIELSSVQDMTQVWFLTQLLHYSVVLDGVLVSLYSESNARGESRALGGRRVSSKSPSRVRDGDELVAGGTEENSICAIA